ncbi:MAG: S1 RNA-binding domain-containing protein [Bacteriovoracaceae bacterium]|jgi:protein Tex|nr:S1 RNA-binding domain-containing protein [Bacteriovoracaceae bacterium]
MSLTQNNINYIVKNTNLNANKIEVLIKLLTEEDCTIPFITRYRKEATGGMDEVQIQSVFDNHEKYHEREKRREFILGKLETVEKLTPKLKQLILNADTLVQLEDIYAPFKVKKKTKGTIAKEKGLGATAESIINGKVSKTELQKNLKLLTSDQEEITSEEDALSGIKDIIIEDISNNSTLKEELRTICRKIAIYRSTKRKKAYEVKGFEKYKDYFEFEQKIIDLRKDKNAHRYLAMRRGMNEKVLKINLLFEFDEAINIFRLTYLKKEYDCLDILKECCENAFKKYIHPSLDLEFKAELKKYADQAAINVFGINLKNLLLMPYLGPKKVLGIDPGVRTGCKIALVGDTGKYVEDTVIYPFAPINKKREAQKIIIDLIRKHNIKHIAIGNGTYGRETLQFIETEVIKANKLKCHVTSISEAGASIYSTSKIGRAEFPKLDPTVRGAISIARRFQDPLAELVKLDAKSIGVGQYQHDVNQSKLNKSLQAVVENCVNYVGVDLNTASAPLLSYISGIGPILAKNIVSHREKNGSFESREQLMKISRYSEKAFLLSAGFLKIYSGINPLDSTFIHPEKYQLILEWAKNNDLEITQILKNLELITKLNHDDNFKEKVGPFTHADIVQSLSSPDKDPREEFQSMQFRDDVSSISDLKKDDWYPGVVTNITNFGAFVDLGIKENGLLHISEMADVFIKNPLDILKVGEKVSVKIKEIDINRKRIALSRKGHSKRSA